ncbi:unnamed protein product, partial [Choristocarpus tenellus]
RTRGYTKRGLEVDLNGQQHVPVLGQETRRSVQAQGPYETERLDAAAEQVLNRLKRVGPREFHAGYRVHKSPYEGGINTGSPFMDWWKNPYLVRGIPKNQAELSKPLKESSLGKYPAKPYYIAVGGNKSAVLPNGRFDVILEAEQTGGVIRNALGRSRRYGVPDTCDVDDQVYPGSTLAHPHLPVPPKKPPLFSTA